MLNTVDKYGLKSPRTWIIIEATYTQADLKTVTQASCFCAESLNSSKHQNLVEILTKSAADIKEKADTQPEYYIDKSILMSNKMVDDIELTLGKIGKIKKKQAVKRQK